MDYIKIESENQKSGLIILLVLFHSACPYKKYYLKCFTELQTLFIYLFINLFFSIYLVCNFVLFCFVFFFKSLESLVVCCLKIIIVYLKMEPLALAAYIQYTKISRMIFEFFDTFWY